MNDADLNFGLLCGLIFGLLIGGGVAAFVHSDWKEDSVKAGKAEYYLDADNNKQWRWK